MSNFVIPPMSLSWSHNEKLLDKSRYSGLSHKVEPKLNLSSKLVMSDILSRFSSSVKIGMASEVDAGNYSCKPGLLSQASITLHVEQVGPLPMLNTKDSLGLHSDTVIVFIIGIML